MQIHSDTENLFVGEGILCFVMGEGMENEKLF